MASVIVKPVPMHPLHTRLFADESAPPSSNLMSNVAGDDVLPFKYAPVGKV